MFNDRLFEVGNALSQFLVAGKDLTEPDKGTYYQYAHVYRFRAVQYSGYHDSAVLSKSVGEIFEVFISPGF